MNFDKLLPLASKAPRMKSQELSELRDLLKFFPKALELPEEELNWLRKFARRCVDVRKCPQNNFKKMALFLRAGMDPDVEEVMMAGAIRRESGRSILQVCLQRGLTEQAQELLYAGAKKYTGYELRSLFSCACDADQLVTLFEYGARPRRGVSTYVERCISDFLAPFNVTNHLPPVTSNSIIAESRSRLYATFHGRAIAVRQLFDTCVALQNMFFPLLLLIEIAEWAAAMRKNYRNQLPYHLAWKMAQKIRSSANIKWV